MRNHAEKVKDMAESVLPSTSRLAARRDRASVHRRTRRAVAQRLAAHDADAVAVLERRRRIAVGRVMWERRGWDKTGSLGRWAERRVCTDSALAGSTLDEKIAHFRRLLPNTTVGRHALDHIRWTLEWSAARANRR